MQEEDTLLKRLKGLTKQRTLIQETLRKTPFSFHIQLSDCKVTGAVTSILKVITNML